MSDRAVQIYEQVLGQLQMADELEGPELADYIKLMHSLDQDINRRIVNATEKLLNELKEGL